MQCTHALRALPVVALLSSSIAVLGAAQGRYRVITDGAWFYQATDGRRLAQLSSGAVVNGDSVAGSWARVTLDGWIFASSVGTTARPGFDLEVTKAPGENLRTAPAGDLVGQLTQGFALNKVEDQARWVHVRRQGWMKLDGLQSLTAVAAGTSTRSDTAPKAADSQPAPAIEAGRAQTARRTMLYRAPDGPEDGALAPTAGLRVLGRSGEWSRVQVDGWVKTADLRAAPPGVMLGVSASELRADPQRFQGQSLRWTLQYISLRTADDLRPDLPDGAMYMLARGPLPERGFVYMLVPDAKRAAVAQLAPLATIQVIARVRAGRSRFIGNPVMELVTIEAQP